MAEETTVKMLFTERMRGAVHNEHEKSNKLVNLKLALVLTSPPLYGEAISLFLPVFEKIESILGRHSEHPQLGKISPLLNTLSRAPGFRADMAYYLTTDRRTELEGSWTRREHAEIADYMDRLDQLAKEDPVLILAYVYHLYAAILTGGQLVRRMVVKAMGLKSDDQCWDGVAAFHVKRGLSIYSPKEVARQLKKILNDEIVLSEEEKLRVIKEGKELFRLNDALVASVKGTKAWRQAANDCMKRTALPLVGIVLFVASLYFVRQLSAVDNNMQ